MQIKHSKYKNTGILFELLVRQITSDTLNGKDTPIKELLKKYFVKTELGREYKLYETLLNKTTLTESKANIIVDTLVESSKNLNRGAIKRQKYNLINEIRNHYDLNEFFNHKLPNYKVYAAFYTLLEVSNSANKFNNSEQIINNKITILEHLTAAPIQEFSSNTAKEISFQDRDTNLIAYKFLLERFNGKYDNLSNQQKSILKEYINSVDNTPRLKEFYSEKLNEIKAELASLNKKTKNEVTKIKINEIISIIQPLSKTSKVSDNDLVDLLQYYDLIKELKSTNG
jgi:polyhydroxyalkanoate synthesis regulator phasin